MLEITTDDIGRLDDGALRELVVRLCEAELSAAGLPTSDLTAGGPQDAPDGGIDVRIDAAGALGGNGYVPRGQTGFQVKASPMPASALANEMAPGGKLRDTISALLAEGGAYVVVCSKASPTDSRLRLLKQKMWETANGKTIHPEAVLDFIGADRLALWCRAHPGVSAWARGAVGRPTEGWFPYGNWSRPSEGIEPELILDESARLIDERSPQDGALGVKDGLERMRALAGTPRSSMRLVGLSGVGKTRLVQAIFDDRIGQGALPEHKALYCDYGTPVSPTPSEIARQLVARQAEVVLLVDNCSPETHRTLSEIVALPGSRVSLLTVEYDVRDDDMEGTEVFRLEPASDDVTVSLIKRRYPHINQANGRRLADIAGGNARIALALAHTVRRGESLGRLRDDGLFERLFFQRNQQDPALLAAAEITSLVYSFDGEDEADTSELAVLAQLAGQSVSALKLACAELGRRDLLQKRSHWRAVLPHAVANRLAARAFERLDLPAVGEAMEVGGQRLLRSFSRRLAFLHDAAQARNLAESWFAADGRLGRLHQITDADFELFRNLAPLAPEAALSAITRGAQADSGWSKFGSNYYGGVRSRHELARLIRALAFDPPMFDEAATRLVEIAIADKENDRQPNKPVLIGLFKLYLSGTMAGPAQRHAFLKLLTDSDDDQRITLGMELLDSMLETHWFGSVDSFDFGARPRSFGWEPASPEDIAAWFLPAIDLAKTIALSKTKLAVQARQILSNRFRGLWWKTVLKEALSRTMITLTQDAFWPEGWIAVRSAIRFAPQDADVSDLRSLEAQLRPSDLLQQARAYGFSKGYDSIDLEDLDEDDDETVGHRGRAERITRKIAIAVAADDEVRQLLIPDLVRSGVQRHWSFGEGLALGADDPATIWTELVDALRLALADDPEPAVLRSFLRAWATRDPEAVQAVFDWLLHEPGLGQWFPFLQTATYPFDAAAVARLLTSLDVGITPAAGYYTLVYGGVIEAIEPTIFATLIAGIAAKEGGHRVALQIFHMRLFSDREKSSIDPAIRQAGRDLLATYSFGSRDQREEANLAELAGACLGGPEGERAAERLLRRLKVAVNRYNAYAHDHDELVATVFALQPRVALDFFLERQFQSHQGRYSRSLLHHFTFRAKPVTHVSENDLLAWAAADPPVRYKRIAACIPIFIGKDPDISDDADRWWPPALALLESAPDRAEILNEYDDHVHPRSWSGSRAAILERRRVAMKRLDDHSDALVREWGLGWQRRLAEMIPQERARESRREQSFE